MWRRNLNNEEVLDYYSCRPIKKTTLLTKNDVWQLLRSRILRTWLREIQLTLAIKPSFDLRISRRVVSQGQQFMTSNWRAYLVEITTEVSVGINTSHDEDDSWHIKKYFPHTHTAAAHKPYQQRIPLCMHTEATLSKCQLFVSYHLPWRCPFARYKRQVLLQTKLLPSMRTFFDL